MEEQTSAIRPLRPRINALAIITLALACIGILSIIIYHRITSTVWFTRDLFGTCLLLTLGCGGIGLITAFIAELHFRFAPRVLRGRWMLFVALPFHVYLLFYAFVAAPALEKVAYSTNIRLCAESQQSLAHTILIYAENHGGRLPTSLNDLPAVDGANCVIEDRAGGKLKHGVNRSLLDKRIQDIGNPETVILIADCIRNDGLIERENDIDTQRHRHMMDYYMVTFLDGHTERWYQHKPKTSTLIPTMRSKR